MDILEIVSVLSRWLHVAAGILWIGLLYWFNFVNVPFAGTMDGETKKKVVPELMPRALYWFRWGAAFTWLTGVLLLVIVFYHGGLMFEPDNPEGWTPGSFVLLVLVFGGVFIYDFLAKSPVGKNLKVFGPVGFVLIAAVIYGMIQYGGFSYRAYVVHIGAMLGTFMAFNVWFRIWPSQKKVIGAIKEGTAPDAALVTLAGTRSRHNTYLSVPLVWTMINMHTTVPAASSWFYLLGIIAIGWIGVYLVYRQAGKVKGS